MQQDSWAEVLTQGELRHESESLDAFIERELEETRLFVRELLDRYRPLPRTVLQQTFDFNSDPFRSGPLCGKMAHKKDSI